MNTIIRLFSSNPSLLVSSSDIRSFTQLKEYSFDVIYCFDIRFLPLVNKYLNYNKLAVDLREAYPLHFNESILWRLLNKKHYWRICDEYLHKSDYLFTVSKGLVNFYTKYFSVDVKLLYSLPLYHEIKITPVEAKKIKLVYHGSSNKNRNLDELICAVGEVGFPYSLYLHLFQNNDAYSRYLSDLSSQFSNIYFKPFLPEKEVVNQWLKI